MVFVEIIILLTTFVLLLYKWSTRNFHILSDRGVPHEKPLPILGNVKLKSIFGQLAQLREAIDLYEKHKHHKVYGSYIFSNALFIVHDLDLIKKIGIKDFDHFVNHKFVSLSEKDKIFGRMLTVLKDQQWKEMRNTLTPSFTGNKMRLMHDLINECSMDDVRYIQEEIAKSDNNEIELEMKDYFTRFANDVIATVAFGVKVNSFKDKENTFFTTGRKMTKFSYVLIVKAVLYSLMPKVMKSLGVSFTDQEMMRYFRDLVFGAIKYRQEHHITRPDMIQLLLEARRISEENATLHCEDQGQGQSQRRGHGHGYGHATFQDEDLLAQCLLFFIAGFEPVSQCLCFTVYELAMNPEIQERLYQEIAAVEEDMTLNGSNLNYDTLMRMEYLNMVISESVRKWPPVNSTDRVASSDHQLLDEDGKIVIEFKKGDWIFFPIFAIHHDAEYYPEPEKFDPERFSKENEHLIRSNSYLPFGIGPRNCIGNRLALMETKLIIYHLVKSFQFAPTERTCTNMIDEIKGFLVVPKQKFPIKVTKRNKF